MDMSFYTASLGARNQQEKMNIIANNIANVNSDGYLAKSAVFTDMMYYNMRDEEQVVTSVQAGSGAIVQRTDTNFDQSFFQPSDSEIDYAIAGRGFFMLEDPVTQEITYTRDGNFSLSLSDEGFRLVTTAGKIVLDREGNHIVMDEEGGFGDAEPGIYDFVILNGMQSVGDNELVPVEKCGEPFLSETASLRKGYREATNVDLADEMANVVETSRAYAYILKMVTTSDEIEQTINGLGQ